MKTVKRVCNLCGKEGDARATKGLGGLAMWVLHCPCGVETSGYRAYDETNDGEIYAAGLPAAVAERQRGDWYYKDED